MTTYIVQVTDNNGKQTFLGPNGTETPDKTQARQYLSHAIANLVAEGLEFERGRDIEQANAIEY